MSAALQEISRFAARWLPQIDAEVAALLDRERHQPEVSAHYGMMRYHLGWVDERFVPTRGAGGKRLRPLLCLLACLELGGDPESSLPAATAVELLHNFSLIHDDIQDGDALRRHRPTLWKRWGVPQAINVGDGMFILAFAALGRLRERGAPEARVLDAIGVFTTTCIGLAEGQHLDMLYEDRPQVALTEYLRMIRGKTAVLLGASARLGALTAGADLPQQEALERFGEAVGLAFQIQDDVLGVWGSPAATGKPAGSDILRRKKTFPLIHALGDPRVGEELAALLREPASAQLPAALTLLERAGSRDYAEAAIRRQLRLAREALERALRARALESPLLALSDGLLHRDT